MPSNSNCDDPAQDFVALFLAHQSSIYGFIVSLLPNRSDADDLLQETGLTLYQKFSTFEPGTDFVAWACRIAYFKVLDFGKRRNRDFLRFGPEFLEQIADDYLQRSEQIRMRLKALDGCMGKLPARDQELLERSYHSDDTVKAIAASQQRPVDTLYKSLRRLRSALLDCIQRTLAREQHL